MNTTNAIITAALFIILTEKAGGVKSAFVHIRNCAMQENLNITFYRNHMLEIIIRVGTFIFYGAEFAHRIHII